MSPLAQSIGANRIVRGKAVPHPFGDPSRTPNEEREFRKSLVEKALEALQVEVKHPTIFDEDQPSPP
jgi:glycine reductase